MTVSTPAPPVSDLGPSAARDPGDGPTATASIPRQDGETPKACPRDTFGAAIRSPWLDTQPVLSRAAEDGAPWPLATVPASAAHRNTEASANVFMKSPLGQSDTGCSSSFSQNCTAASASEKIGFTTCRHPKSSHLRFARQPRIGDSRIRENRPRETKDGFLCAFLASFAEELGACHASSERRPSRTVPYTPRRYHPYAHNSCEAVAFY